MSIEVFGIVTLVVILLTPFIKLKNHFFIMVFFSLFTATAAFNIEKGGLSLSIIPVHLIGMTFALRMMINIVKKRAIHKKSIWLTLFVLWSTISVVLLPIIDDYIPNHVTVRHYFSGEGFDPIAFSTGNVTQLAYLLFGYIIYFVTVEYIMSSRDPFKLINQTITVLVAASIVICFIGIYEMIAKFLNLPYTEIFRNFSGVVIYTNYRISSVAHEPSMFAYCIIICAALMCFHNSSNTLLRKNKNKFFLFIILVGLFSTSTTFLLGFLILLFYASNDYVNTKKLNMFASAKFYFSILGIAFSGYWLLNIPFIKEKTVGRAVETLTFSNFSGADRIEKVIHHLDAFTYSPILGLGFGTTRSYDAFTTILCNLGIIGMLIFILYVFTSIRKINKVKRGSNKDIAKSLQAAFICWLIMFMISVPEMYFIYLWILFALIEVTIATQKKQPANSFNEKKI
ncbi:hypothetical protein [Domibacillus robiginosus]|uniref:hypothetical protein n=1 Tax=Domibacillus robiginosus TaxID=1071054 RepID=UPI00067D243D|nr:hypothetical protein [Domibacillus robiginosus]